MQLCLETADMDLIANILLEREREILSSFTPRHAEPGTTTSNVNMSMCEEILERLLARDTAFDSDELDQLALILAEEERLLKARITRESAEAAKAALEKKRSDLQRVLERIEEVCVML
jgi:hypothetical protein